MIYVKNLDIEAMAAAIKKVVALCGPDVLANELKFQAVIKDLLNSNFYKREQQILIFTIKIGIGREICKAITKSSIEQNRVLTALGNILIHEYGFSSNRCHEILVSYAMGLDWEKLELARDYQPVNDTSVSKKTSQNMLLKGELITFGNYKWRVLHVKGRTALLISDGITDIGIPYNSSMENTTWETCSLRKWLNSEFLARFSSEEQDRVLFYEVKAENNQWYQTDAGNSTKDKVFILSISEAVRFFGDSGDLHSRPDNDWMDDIDANRISYAIDDKFNINRCAAYKNENTWWWLRSPGKSETKAAYINSNGIILLNGELVFDDGGTSCVGVRPGVRPAIWLQQ